MTLVSGVERVDSSGVAEYRPLSERVGQSIQVW